MARPRPGRAAHAPCAAAAAVEQKLAGRRAIRFDGCVRCVVQRVARATVVVDGEVVGAIGRGLLVLVCAMDGDDARDERWIVDKLVALRIFADDAGKMNKSIVDIAAGGAAGVLVVSQFTLAADLSPGRSKGTRPSFTRAAPPAYAKEAVDRVVVSLRGALPDSVAVATGRFAADMKVSLENDGPVTLWLDSAPDAQESRDPGVGERT
jgi:D-tyrosyl-tRNA(Tyr) deacylase